jgi:hypothetical protein
MGATGMEVVREKRGRGRRRTMERIAINSLGQLADRPV